MKLKQLVPAALLTAALITSTTWSASADASSAVPQAATAKVTYGTLAANEGPIVSNVVVSPTSTGLTVKFDYAQRNDSSWAPLGIGLYSGPAPALNSSTYTSKGYGLLENSNGIGDPVIDYVAPQPGVISSGSFSQTFTGPRTKDLTVIVFTSRICDCMGGTVFAAGATVKALPKAVPGKVTVTGKAFKKGSKPTVTVKVGKLNTGAYPAGTVTVKVAGKTVGKKALKASAKGKVTVKLTKRYSKTIKVKATFTPSKPDAVKSRSSSTVKIKVKR